MAVHTGVSNWVLTVVCLGLSASVFSQAPYCTPTTGVTPGPNDPPFPQLPQTFQTRIEATIQDKNYTVSAEEYYDGNNNKATLTMYKAGEQFKLIFDYANDQLFYAYPDGSCKVDNLTNDNNNILFGNNVNGGKIHVFTTTGVLHFLQQNQIYMGRTAIRGVQCDHWRTCTTWNALNATFTLDYYFTTQQWVNPAGWPQIPVRAEVKGSQKMSDTVYVPFHHYYDYVNFRVEIDATSDVFLTPPGVVCPGRKQTRPVPSLKGAYIYREEIVAPINNAITEADVWYDDLYKLVRYDYRPQPNTPPYYNTDAASEIHDFNTGISYNMDKTMGNCTITPITNTSFDASINVTTSLSGKPSFVLQMKSPGQLFYLDNSYTFEGQRFARDMVCDVFISKRNDFKLGGLTLNATFQFFFLAKSYTEKNNEGNIDQKDTDIPIRLDITVSGIPYSARYNIYDFSQEHPELTKFDIRTCFDIDDKTPFKITFPGTFDAKVRVYREVFLFQSITLVSEATGVSPLRVQGVDFQMEYDQAFFVGTLLEKAPSISKFRKIQGKVLQYHNDKTISYVSQASDCADYCVTSNFTCNSFDYCPQSQVCTLSRSHTEDGTLVGTGGSCDHYSRTLGSAFRPEPDLQTVWEKLRNAVVRGLFVLNIQYDTATVAYKASDITSSVSLGGQRDPSSTGTLQHFRAMHNKYVPNYDDDIETGLSVDDCGAACVAEEVFVCNSFEYEWKTGRCFLSHFHPDDDPKKIQNNNGIDLYIRDYTSKFNMQKGTTVLSSSPVIYQGIYDVNECAKLCVDYHEFPCKSFDYCDEIGTCFIGKVHVLDVPKSGIKVSPQCDHYSRQYIDDFQHYKRKLMKMVDDRVITGLSLAECAKACVDQEASGCATFSYCGNYTECRLSGVSLSSAGQSTVQASAYCDIYSRKYFPNGKVYTAPVKAPAPSGYSGGAMAGLALGMIVLGVILAAVVVVIYLKASNKTMDDMKISFKRMDENSES